MPSSSDLYLNNEKGTSVALDPHIERCHRRLQLFDHPQMLTNQEAMVA